MIRAVFFPFFLFSGGTKTRDVGLFRPGCSFLLLSSPLNSFSFSILRSIVLPQNTCHTRPCGPEKKKTEKRDPRPTSYCMNLPNWSHVFRLGGTGAYENSRPVPCFLSFPSLLRLPLVFRSSLSLVLLPSSPHTRNAKQKITPRH